MRWGFQVWEVLQNGPGTRVMPSWAPYCAASLQILLRLWLQIFGGICADITSGNESYSQQYAGFDRLLDKCSYWTPMRFRKLCLVFSDVKRKWMFAPEKYEIFEKWILRGSQCEVTLKAVFSIEWLCLRKTVQPKMTIEQRLRFGVNATFVATHWRKLLKRSQGKVE